MNRVTFNHIKSAVDSLCESTCLKIHTPQGGVRLGRQRSPYLSHQQVEYFETSAECLLFVNDKCSLAISGIAEGLEAALLEHGWPEDEYEHECQVADVPRVLVAPLLELVQEYFMDRRFAEGQMVCVGALQRVVEGWERDEESGRCVPVFARCAPPDDLPDWSQKLYSAASQAGACAHGLATLREVLLSANPGDPLPSDLWGYISWAGRNLSREVLPPAWADEVFGKQ
jgi:hypothetical protein